MRLQPVTTETTASYPERRASLYRIAGRWIKRVGAVAAVSTAFWLSGCDPFAISGDIAMPEYFVCADTSPDSPPLLDGDGTFSGSFCEGQRSWSGLDVAEQRTIDITLTTSGDCPATAWIIDPEGTAVEVIEANEPDVSVELTPGRWLIGVSRDEGCEAWSFDLNLTPVED